MEEHESRVRDLRDSVRRFRKAGTTFRLYHGRTHSTRPSVLTQHNTLDITPLSHILSVSVERRTCLVEPNVTMEVLVEAVTSHGLILPVVPECPGITVGGAFAGTAGESSSFRHGLFDATVNWCEVMLADGEVVRASADDHADLFQGLKGTLGTLGIGVLFEIRLLQAKEYMELSYHVVCHGIAGARELIQGACRQPAGDIDFVDGIMFDHDHGVVMTGRLVDSNCDGLPVITFHRPWDPWHYLHAKDVMESFLSQANLSSDGHSVPRRRELVPLRSYLFRYDRGAFWTGRYAFAYFRVPCNRITRYLCDRLMRTRVMYHALHRSGIVDQYIIQDVGLPLSTVDEFYQWLDVEFTIYPLWLCPVPAKGVGGGLDPQDKLVGGPNGVIDFLLDVGVWGPCPGEPIAANRMVEAKVRELGGLKCLYAQTEYTLEEFWAIYDRQSYQSLREKYGAIDLPDVYDKVGSASNRRSRGSTSIWSIWPFAGIYGVLSCVKGGDYLRKGHR